jgi:flagellar assembly factor FliW
MRPMTTSDASRQTMDAASDATSATITFPEGLIGCPNWHNFVLMTDSQEDLPVAVLQSQDDPKVALMITNPALLVPEYTVTLSVEARQALQLETGTPTTYCTLSVTQDGSLTANLLGPLVVNPSNRRGMQLVLSESAYSTRHPVALLGRAEG